MPSSLVLLAASASVKYFTCMKRKMIKGLWQGIMRQMRLATLMHATILKVWTATFRRGRSSLKAPGGTTLIQRATIVQLSCIVSVINKHVWPHSRPQISNEQHDLPVVQHEKTIHTWASRSEMRAWAMSAVACCVCLFSALRFSASSNLPCSHSSFCGTSL